MARRVIPVGRESLAVRLGELIGEYEGNLRELRATLAEHDRRVFGQILKLHQTLGSLHVIHDHLRDGGMALGAEADPDDEAVAEAAFVQGLVDAFDPGRGEGGGEEDDFLPGEIRPYVGPAS